MDIVKMTYLAHLVKLKNLREQVLLSKYYYLTTDWSEEKRQQQKSAVAIFHILKVPMIKQVLDKVLGPADIVAET